MILSSIVIYAELHYNFVNFKIIRRGCGAAPPRFISYSTAFLVQRPARDSLLLIYGKLKSPAASLFVHVIRSVRPTDIGARSFVAVVGLFLNAERETEGAEEGDKRHETAAATKGKTEAEVAFGRRGTRTGGEWRFSARSSVSE